MQQQLLKFNDPPNPAAELPFVGYTYPAGTWNGLIFVGEAPGAEEVRLSAPFVGRSGQLLDKILAQSGIKRDECIIANVFRLRPPDNKVDHFFVSRRAASAEGIEIAEEYGKFGSGYCRAAFAREIENLRDLLAEKKPKIVMALGRTPLWALTGESGLLEKAGKTLPCRLLPTLEVIPTFHPSFILRGNWKLQDEWLVHFHRAAKYI